MAASFFVLRGLLSARAIRGACEFVRFASAARSIVAQMKRDLFYFLLAVAGILIVASWLVFVVLAE